jgi:phospholipase C
MVIVSPYAKAGAIDSTNATFASILAFTEHTFGLAPLAANDAVAYDYANSFDYFQAPLPGPPLTSHPLPPATVAYLHSHPNDADDDDVT